MDRGDPGLAVTPSASIGPVEADGEPCLDVSVVMPVRNGEQFLASQLHALAANDFAGTWEFIISDNGSTDSTRAIAGAYTDRLPLRVVDSSSQPGISHARNVAIASARGRLLLFCDADDEVAPDWISAIHRDAQHFPVVGGPLAQERLNDQLSLSWKLENPAHSLPEALGLWPYAVGANMGVWRSVARELGGFDQSFIACGDDVDFSWRAQLAGHTVHFVHDAVVHYRLRSDARTMVRQRFEYGRAAAKLYSTYRNVGARRTDPRDLLRLGWFLASRMPLLWSPRRRGVWLSRLAYEAGVIAGSVQARTLYW